MADTHQPWTPDFADPIDKDSDVGKDKTKIEVSSGRKRVGSDHSGLCRRPPPSSPRR